MENLTLSNIDLRALRLHEGPTSSIDVLRIVDELETLDGVSILGIVVVYEVHYGQKQGPTKVALVKHGAVAWSKEI